MQLPGRPPGFIGRRRLFSNSPQEGGMLALRQNAIEKVLLGVLDLAGARSVSSWPICRNPVWRGASKSLSLTVVAQGVETKEQAEFLRTHACDELQGFYFNRPLPADQFTQLLLAQATEITYTGKSLVLRTM
jgi:hypothetical protein